MLLKRYLLHDPYAHVTLLQILQQLWRVLAFYVFAGSLLWVLSRRAEGRRVLAILASASIPLLLFAVLVFEPGSIERYLPLYPFLCLAVAYGLSRFPEHSWAATAIAVFLCLSIFLNVAALLKSSLMSQRGPSVARARSLESRVDANGLIALVSLRDELYMLGSHPFEPEVRHAVLPVYDVLEPGNLRSRSMEAGFRPTRVELLPAKCQGVDFKEVSRGPAAAGVGLDGR